MPVRSPIGLLGFGAYAPERVMTNADWAARVDTSDDWIVRRTGIRERRIADPAESTVDLAERAARAAIEDAGLDTSDIGELIVASDTPEVRIPDTSALVQHRLGLPEVPTYDLGGSGCAGFVLALDVAAARARWHGRNVLVIGVEVLTRLMDWQDRNTCVLFGDAAGAAIVGITDGGSRLLAATAGTDGGRAGILGLEVGGTRKPITAERVAERAHVDIVMNGREVFRSAVERMCGASREVLERAGMDLASVALVVPHQANMRILKAVANELALPMERVYVNVDRFGNTGSASVPLALTQARDEGRVGPGDVVLLTSFGAGLHWAAALVRL